MHKTIAIFLLGSLSAQWLSAQCNPDRILVVSRSSGTPATLLLELDPATGAQVPFSRFPADILPPLAVAVDPANREPVLALADPLGTRIVRLEVRGVQVLGETLLAVLPGTAVGMTVPSTGNLLVAIGGAAGGLFFVDRRRGTATTFWSAPGVTALSDPVILPGKVWAAQSLPPAPPSISAFLDTSPGGPVSGPRPIAALLGREITGIHEFLGSGGRRQLVADTQGRVHELTMLFESEVLLQPPIVPGGAVAMKGGIAPQVLVLGGSADPTLKSFPQTSAMVQRPVTVVGGPFPGDPVDFARTQPATARAVAFGQPCANPAGGRILADGLPSLGNASFALQFAQGLPMAPAALVLGTSDRLHLGAPLPITIGTCDLLVSIDQFAVAITDRAGAARYPLPVPNRAALAGAIVFAQWGQELAAPRTSDAIALQVF